MRHKIHKRENPYKIVIYTFSLLLSFAYICYRIFFTVPIELGIINAFFGIILITLEIFEFITFCIFFINTLCLKKASPKTPKIKPSEYPEVDILIATINEDSKLLTETINACKNLKYSDKKKVKIYLCDDGNRKEIKKLTKSLGVNYISRKDNKFAKAGNYNNALQKTKSPYIVFFDADMKPEPDFLQKTIPFFIEDKNMGFVQTPQSFNNPDIFQNHLGLNTPFEQDYFYHKIQLAKNNINSTILCGTNCVISRVALTSVCGFATNTVAEDIATGMLIEANGYTGIAIDENLAHGESIDEIDGFLKQRSRWGRGCIQTYKNYGFFWRKGLTLRQKLDYFVSIEYWTYGLKTIIYLVLPLLFPLLGIIAIKGDLRIFMTFFLTQLFVKSFIIDACENHARSSVWNKIYEIILMPIMAKDILKELIGLGNHDFDVTPKGIAKTTEKKSKNKLLFSHLFFLILSLIGVGFSIFRIITIDFGTYIIPLIWLIVNILFILIAIVFDVRKRKEYPEFTPNKVNKYSLKSYINLMRRK